MPTWLVPTHRSPTASCHPALDALWGWAPKRGDSRTAGTPLSGVSSTLEEALTALARARRVVVVTGAGMSRESGVPTFREAQTGLWSQFDPTELATEAAFRRHPARVFGWYLWRLRLTQRAVPHAGYGALVRLEEAFERLVVVTQNVDGLHARAGNTDVVELHGSLARFRCLDGGHPYDAEQLDALPSEPERDVDPPVCAICTSPVRPGVVWFGESLPPQAMKEAWDAVEEANAMLVVGTSAVVYPAAALPATALDRGLPVIEINPQRTPLSSRATVSWQQSAGEALTALSDGLMRAS